MVNILLSCLLTDNAEEEETLPVDSNLKNLQVNKLAFITFLLLFSSDTSLPVLLFLFVLLLCTDTLFPPVTLDR